MRIYTLNPGELVSVESPQIITTVLGSCVSLTFFSVSRQIGIMNHAMLPRAPAFCQPEEVFRYVDTSLDYIMSKIEKLKLMPNEMEIKLFGGANMMQKGVKCVIGVGESNVAATMSLLKKYGLVLKSRDTGGGYGRRVMFNTATGEVLVKKLK